MLCTDVYNDILTNISLWSASIRRFVGFTLNCISKAISDEMFMQFKHIRNLVRGLEITCICSMALQ